MKIAASTLYGIMTQSVIDSVNQLEEAGFDTIELVYEYNNLFGDKEVEILKKKNLTYSMHGPFMFVSLAHPNPKVAKIHLDMLDKSLKLASKLGCKHYVLHGGLIFGDINLLDKSKGKDDILKLLVERIKPILNKYSDVKVLIENMVNKHEIGIYVSDILKVKEQLDVGFCFDIAHSELHKITDDFINKLKVDHLHVSDNNLTHDDHLTIGEGKIDFKTIIEKLKQKGFDRTVVIENDSLEDCKKSLNNLKKLI